MLTVVNPSLIVSAVRAKAPVVAIPVEGHAPFCIRRKQIAGWYKGVTITSVRFEQEPPIWYPEEQAVSYYFGAIGPKNMVAIQSTFPRYLVIEGRAGAVKTRVKLNAIPRRDAIRELGKWSDAERERQQKRIMLGDLAPALRKELKRAKLGDEGVETVATQYRMKDKTIETRQGIPVAIPEVPELTFAIIRLAEDSWSVTETTSGLSAGRGTSPEEAVIEARKAARKAGPAKIEQVRRKILEAA